MKILQLVLETSRLEQLAEFYEQAMELPVTRRSLEIEMVAGSSRIIFRQTKLGEAPFYHFAIVIPSNKIEEARLWMAGRAELLWMPEYNSDIADFRNWKAKSIYFLDPGGNIVELIARFELNNASPGSFSPSDFLSVNEIGVVYTPGDIDRNTDALMDRTGIRYFSRQPPLPHFRAIGDDDGLFIVVPEDRNWYPTQDKHAGRFPLEVKFEVNGKLMQEAF